MFNTCYKGNKTYFWVSCKKLLKPIYKVKSYSQTGRYTGGFELQFIRGSTVN